MYLFHRNNIYSVINNITNSVGCNSSGSSLAATATPHIKIKLSFRYYSASKILFYYPDPAFQTSVGTCRTTIIVSINGSGGLLQDLEQRIKDHPVALLILMTDNQTDDTKGDECRSSKKPRARAPENAWHIHQEVPKVKAFNLYHRKVFVFSVFLHACSKSMNNLILFVYYLLFSGKTGKSYLICRGHVC